MRDIEAKGLRLNGEWHFDEGRHLRCRVLEGVNTWGQTAVRVWYPEAQIILLVAPEQLKPVEDLRTSPQEIVYITVAAKVADAIVENTLLARTAALNPAETQQLLGHPLYEELLRFHQGRPERERQNKRYAFDARRRAIERIGLLPCVSIA